MSGMPPNKKNKPQDAVTIAVSSGALFNMVDDRKPLKPGAAFPFVKALMHVNSQLRELYPDSEELFDIVLITNHHAQDEERLRNSLKHYDLTPRCCTVVEETTTLYLSEDAERVREAINKGIAAATMFMPEMETELSANQLMVAFDGDAVLFSDESEIIMKEHGLDAFLENEKELENKPLAQGPLKCFLEALVKLQRKFYAKVKHLDCPIRTFLVTSRGGGSSATRVLKTLNSWDLDTNGALFLAGAPKGPMLQQIRPHIFFDDNMDHIEGAKELGTISAHVPYGIRNC